MKLPRILSLLGLASLLLVLPAAFSSPAAAQFGVGISVRIGPPALPVYEQPVCPGEGYMWTPGYWAWDDDDGYYWVPGTWVEAPQPGLLWTPGYWGWNDGAYAWNDGYWGPQVGFYGGIDYGYGYGGNGFYGGEWRNNSFYYNTAVMHVNTTEIRNVYVNRTVIVNNNSHVAFNGGQGGVQARPTPQQESYMHEHHTPPVAAQEQQVHAARQNRALFASNNHGRPAVAATAKPGEFSGRGVVAAKAAGAPYHAPKMSPKEARASTPAGNHAAGNRPAEKRPAENHAAAKTAHPSAAHAKNNAAKPENMARKNESHPTHETAPSRAESTPKT
ncbi:MAG TPA: YXWGXW repeat-containing protein, partial [Acidobacteriaceae bacterium]|nr:YXWGXW repeat-containing protein [Acidobacteriaceae bacterium]